MGARMALASAIFCIVALAAAGTAIGVALDDATGGRRCHPNWVDVFILAAGGVSAVCAGIVISLQALRSCVGASRTRWAVAVVSALGLAANAAMLVLLTVYWRHFASRFYWRPYLGDSNRVYPVARRINYFEHSHRWTQEDCALYWVGCAAGTAAWLLTALLAALDLRAARRNAAAAAAESIPLTAALLSGGDSSSSVTVRMAPSPVKATSVLGSRLLQVFWPQ